MCQQELWKGKGKEALKCQQCHYWLCPGPRSCSLLVFEGFLGASDSEGPSCQCKRPEFDPCIGKTPWEGNGSVLAWRIPWTEEPGGLQSMGSDRVRHDWNTNTLTSERKILVFGVNLASRILLGGKYCRNPEPKSLSGEMVCWEIFRDQASLGRFSPMNSVSFLKFHWMPLPQEGLSVPVGWVRRMASVKWSCTPFNFPSKSLSESSFLKYSSLPTSSQLHEHRACVSHSRCCIPRTQLSTRHIERVLNQRSSCIRIWRCGIFYFKNAAQ